MRGTVYDRAEFPSHYEGRLKNRLLRSFAKSELGSEMAEFALALAVFSIAAMSGWAVLANAGNNREVTMQTTLTSSAISPP